MAQKVLVQVLDDIDGSEAEQTVPFSLDGVDYEIDLSRDNAEALRDVLAQFVSVARRVGGRKVRSTAVHTSGPVAGGGSVSPEDRERSRAIRAWALENGFEISDRGRMPREVIEAFEAAEAKPAKATRKRGSRK
ncbi:Lsr2 family protein [Amycolatopsis sp. NPDC059021]|uniref:histone-like nucleoid-structuring protein Lsr2 n=1 Tax=Amycolatopsis sp. NPDC059021 TaxID=3346704 RepID=UPI003670C179